MKFGLHLPYYVEPPALADLAREAEEIGWDGVFVWDPICGIDVWISLAAVAMRTERIRLGTMLTPPSRRRPWTLAAQAATLDRLSNGRFTLSVGLGAAGPEHPNSEFHKVGEETDRKIRAQMLDESLEILNGLWSGKPFNFDGEHFHIEDMTGPKPIQSPRIPIWVVGAWPREKSMRRVLRCDGLLPTKMASEGKMVDFSAADIREMKAYVEEKRTLTTPFDIVVEGETPGNDPEKAASIVRDWADGGVTWWLEDVWATPWEQGGLDGILKRIRQGVPKL
jgi:alkanesulfonate monooxygenase SsuD/methylene tetrahydromethanopterin reductase-like flavin-dependent oxidoreductase (luciferase family)